MSDLNRREFVAAAAAACAFCVACPENILAVTAKGPVDAGDVSAFTKEGVGGDGEGAGGCGRGERVCQGRRLRCAFAEPGIFSDLQQGKTLRDQQHLHSQGESGVDRFGESWAAQVREAWVAVQPRWQGGQAAGEAVAAAVWDQAGCEEACDRRSDEAV